ncbi:MAG TPA: HAMP domain-containing protein [Candidatus Acidoferrum sp.]|nr:HAMP domain-containing protein [Candidatus Acidoferrum sp.]
MKLGIAKSFQILAPGNSLRKRTAYSLAIVRLILVPVILLSVYYLFRMGAIVDRIVNVDAPAAAYAQEASIQMLEARRAERNYLLLHDATSLETNHNSVKRAEALLDQMRTLEPDDLGAIEAAASSLKLYGQRFAAAESALVQPGQTPNERIREVISAYEQDLENLFKNGVRKNREQLLDDLRKRVGSFDSQISESIQMSNPELKRVTDDLQLASQETLSVTADLENRNWARVQNDHTLARHLLRQAEIALTVVSAITLIVSIWVSYVLPRQVVKPLMSLKEAVDHASQGNYAIEFDVQGKGETADLARSLQQMFAAIRQRS